MLGLRQTRRGHGPRRIGLTLVTVGVLLVAAACTSSSAKSSKTPSPAGTSGTTGSGATSSPVTPGGTLQVWVRGSGDSVKAYQALFDAFTLKTGIKVKLFMTLTDFETKLSAAAAAHTLPDVVVDDAAQLGAFHTEGILRQVNKNSIAGNADLTDASWNSAKDVTGDYYAVPFSAQANLMFIRSDWLKKVGATAPTTWAQLTSLAKAFTTQDPDGDGKANTYGLDVPGSTTRGYISWYWSSFLWQAGGDYFTSAGNGKYLPAINSAKAIAAATYFESMFCSSKVVQPGALNDVTTDTNQVFQTGTAGIYLTGPYAYATMDNTPIKGKYAVAAPPAGPAGIATLAEGTDIYLMAGSKQDAQSQALAEYMITPAAQILGMTKVPTATIVRLPVNKTVNAATVHGNDPRWKLAQLVYQQYGHYEPDYMPNWNTFRVATSDALNAMIAKCGNPTTTMNTLAATFKTDLQQQGVLASS